MASWSGVTEEIVLDSECTVLTFKEGLLSRVAHDLKLRFDDHRVSWNPDTGSLRANFKTTSLRVVCARVHGKDAPGALSARDKEKIEEHLHKDVLRCAQHPDATLEGALTKEGTHARFEGNLRICGVERAIKFEAQRTDAWSATLTLHQPDYGIKPFTAALGTLKVKPSVEVQVVITPPER